MKLYRKICPVCKNEFRHRLERIKTCSVRCGNILKKQWSPNGLQRLKMSLFQSGKKKSELHKEKIGLAHLGKKRPPFSEEWRKNLKKAHLGLKYKITKFYSLERKLKLSLRFTGSGNPHWKGGVSRNYQFKIAKRDWKNLSKEIYKRDLWKCQDCDKNLVSRNIQCHHVIPYALTQDDNKNNLVTLCRSCHTKAEHQFQFIL